ncbi:hypothetical protein N5V81_14070 [Escherichia coli]|nr:hypothetical protein [Escherichia coli]
MDKKLVQSWQAVKNYVYGLLEEDKKTKITSIFISSDMTIEGIKYIRVANYKHMFEEESLDGTATFFGAKLQRKQDKVIIFNFIQLQCLVGILRLRVLTIRVRTSVLWHAVGHNT